MIESGNEIVIVTEIAIGRARGRSGGSRYDILIVWLFVIVSCNLLINTILSLANSLFSLPTCISVYWS